MRVVKTNAGRRLMKSIISTNSGLIPTIPVSELAIPIPTLASHTSIASYYVASYSIMVS